MVYAPTSLKNLTIADLSTIQIIHHVKDRKFGRRFTAVYQINGLQYKIEEAVFHQLYRKAKKLTKQALINKNSSELELVKSFSSQLLTAENNASEDYDAQGCIYKIRTAFHRFFGATPWYGSHVKRVEKLLDKINKNSGKNISDEWLACLENHPKAGSDVDILKSSQTFQTDICPMFPGEYQTAKLVERDSQIENEINTFARRAHTLIDSSVKKILSDFLENKLDSGSNEEKALYQNMSLEDFVKRLLSKRPLSISPYGFAYLRDRTTAQVDSPLPLDDYLSNDEMQVSAFLVTATPTHFINQGEYTNVGNRQDVADFQRKGIYYGISGARLAKKDFLEEELVYFRPDRIMKDLAKRFSFFADEGSEGDFYEISESCFLDKTAYKKIMEVRISAFLKDAENQAKSLGKKAYLHVIPLGLELPLFSPSLPMPLQLILSGIQRQIYKDQIELHQFANIDTLNFSHFPGIKKAAEEEPIGTIKVLSSFRNTADKLDDDNLLLCAQYESHPGCFPGNEYWKNNRIGEGTTPALCSTIAELANPYINENITNLYIYK